MKTIIIALSLALLSVAQGQATRQSDCIAPEDFGAHKWILSGEGAEGHVVIFRDTTRKVREGQTRQEIYDSVQYFPGEEVTGSAFFYDPGFFDMSREEEPNWYWSRFGGTGWIPGKWVRSETHKNRIVIRFESETWGTTEKTMEVLVLPYEQAKALHPDLPAIEANQTWEWCGHLEGERE